MTDRPMDDVAQSVLSHSIILRPIDYSILALYIAFVVGIGAFAKRKIRTSDDFFLAGRSMPSWIAGIAFLSANLGAQEVIGMGASGAKYGIATCHFYWMAIPAMVFAGLFMMPFYYGSKARSVPEYLKMRFDEKTRALNAISFAVMTVFSSGVSMYVMGKLFNLLLGWNFNVSVLVSAAIVLAYTLLGGLTSAIYNEVLQFFLIIAGFAPLTYMGLRASGGWSGLKQRLAALALQNGYPAEAYTEAWRFMGNSSSNPVGVEYVGLAMGLGFVLAFGYWCTDFLVVQRAMAADSMESARKAPPLAAIPKLFFPILVVLPGMIAVVINPSPTQAPLAAHALADSVSTSDRADKASGIQGIIPQKLQAATGRPLFDSANRPVLDYDLATPMMLIRFYSSGLLGLGLTALLASFMSGMAGNVTAFNTVWTYDIYQNYIRRNASDRHYLLVGRYATLFGIALSIAAAYIAASFNNIMDLLQLIFAFVNAPLFATFALGMFWRRATGHAAFIGLISGTVSAMIHHGLTLPRGAVPGIKGGFLLVAGTYRSELAQTFWTAIVAFSTCLLTTVAVSLFTQPKQDYELTGLVYSLTPSPQKKTEAWYRRASTLAILVLLAAFVLNLIFF